MMDMDEELKRCPFEWKVWGLERCIRIIGLLYGPAYIRVLREAFQAETKWKEEEVLQKTPHLFRRAVPALLWVFRKYKSATEEAFTKIEEVIKFE